MTKTILILAANPRETDRLRLDQEVREIGDGLERAQKRDEFNIKCKLAPRQQDVRRAMLDFKPNVVHFCGHGAGAEGIAFEDESGQAKLVNADVLSGFFKLFADNLECVFLNACLSDAQASAIARHIPCIIGMRGNVVDHAAIAFAVAFYDALGAGKSFEFAYELALNATLWTGTSSGITPVIETFGLRILKTLNQLRRLLRTMRGIGSDTGLDNAIVADQLDILVKDGFVKRIVRGKGERWDITTSGRRRIENMSRENRSLS